MCDSFSFDITGSLQRDFFLQVPPESWVPVFDFSTGDFVDKSQYVNTSAPSLRCLVVYPSAESMDKWSAAIREALGKMSAADREAFFSSTVTDSRRDFVARITHSGHK